MDLFSHDHGFRNKIGAILFATNLGVDGLDLKEPP
jgi:hypothetical protein